MKRFLPVLLLSGCSTRAVTGGDEKSGATGPVRIEELSVSVHDTMASLLVVRWSQSGPATTWVEYSFDEGIWLSTPPLERPEGEAEALVLGVPFDTVATLRVAQDATGESARSETVTATTGPLPDGAPVAESVEGDEAAWDAASPWVLTCGYGQTAAFGGGWSFIVDRQGRTVWALENDNRRISLQTQLSYDGTQILIDQNSFWAIYDDGAAAEVDRVSITGDVLETIATPHAHHPFTELPDGSLVWGAATASYRDETLEKLGPDGTQETIWSCGAFLESLGQERGNYCGSNTIFWNPSTDTFLSSFYSIETIVEIDHATGETLRYFGHVDDGAWAFDPPESAFWWQHGVNVTPAGTLLLSTKDAREGDSTVAREYAMDPENETLTEVWSFGEDQGVYADTMGEADLTASGHVLHNYGSTPRLREITPEGEVVWDITWQGSYIGRSTPISDLYTLLP